MASRSKSTDPDQYTKPELRERLKEKVKRGDKGGKPGQWSARKAQLLVQEYEKAGGDYTKPRSASQRHLKAWGEEAWTTADGKPAERKGGTSRYLPKKAWSKLTEGEKKATNAKKRAGSRKGKQFVANTGMAKGARKAATK
jgi:hypothetical protein